MLTLRRLLVAFFAMSTLLLAVNYEVDARQQGQDSRSPLTTSVIDVPGLGTVTRAIYTEPSTIDSNWPVVHRSAETYIDEAGNPHIITVTIRVSQNATLVSDTCFEEQLLANQTQEQIVAAVANCVRAGDITVSSSHTINSVKHYLKHYAYKYCSGPDCSVYQPRWTERYWTRSNTSWDVRNAYVLWGCVGGCATCDGGSTSVNYQEPSFTPSWQSSTKSYVYTLNSTQFPIMQGSWGGFITAVSHSDAYKSGGYQYHMEVYAQMP